MRDEIQCLLDWLDSAPSDEKAHRILRALAKESLKKADLEEGKRKFTNKEILAAANESLLESSANKWVNWKKTVLPYWKAKKEQIIEFSRSQGMTTYPELGYYISEKGGRGNESNYWLKTEPLPKINTNDDRNSEQEKNKNLSVIYYEKAENGKIKPAWWVKSLFDNGQIRLSSWHIYVLIGWLFILGISTVVLSYLMWIGLTIPKPVTTQELTVFVSIFIFPFVIWLAFIKPWVRLFDDRIVPASENLIAFKEKAAQMELFRDGDLRLIRLVRYSAPCPICGATIYLDKGEPDFPRRMVGRCNESPREHIYSFDRVTQKGSVLRMP